MLYPMGDGAISIHAPREGGDGKRQYCWANQEISIHAPREGGDVTISTSAPTITISIHAPREGGDTQVLSHDNPSRQFQSTPPARGATSASAE